jgi:hypothetical protein
MDIDPSQATEIKKIKKPNALSKVLNVLSFGLATERKEHETFTAISILEQVYNGLKSMNVDNIVRLSVDNFDFYLDDTGREQDLEDVVDIFNKMIDPLSSKLFDSLYLVIEHLEQSIKYLIEIRVKRKHQVGEYPIVIIVNGVFNDFKLSNDESIDNLRKRMNVTFQSQKDYDNYTSTKKIFFNEFVQRLETMIRQNIPIDDLRIKNSIDIISAKNSIKSIDEIPVKKDSMPVFYGYFSFDRQIMYCFLWAQLMYDLKLGSADFRTIDEEGSVLIALSTAGLMSGEYDWFDNSSNTNETYGTIDSIDTDSIDVSENSFDDFSNDD